MGRHGHAFMSNHIICVMPWEDEEQLELPTRQKQGLIPSSCALLNACLGAAIPAARREEGEDGGWDWRGGGGRRGGGGSSGYANEAVGSQRQSRCGPRLSREATGAAPPPPSPAPDPPPLPPSLAASRLPRLPRPPALAPAWTLALRRVAVRGAARPRAAAAAERGRPPLPGGGEDVGH